MRRRGWRMETLAGRRWRGSRPSATAPATESQSEGDREAPVEDRSDDRSDPSPRVDTEAPEPQPAQQHSGRSDASEVPVDPSAAAGGPPEAEAAGAPASGAGAARSPADAFRDLAQEVSGLAVHVHVVSDYVQRSAEEALQSARAARLAGERAAVDSLLRIHRAIFRIQSSRRGVAEPGEVDKVLGELRLEVEDQMTAFGIVVQEPATGGPVDRTWMAARVADARASELDVPGVISRVMACGYLVRDGAEFRVHQQAEVAVFAADDAA